ncbi:MAG: phosphoribosyltransferase [Anaerolineae bacterium]|nr:phosphoribosyltransferase [Anaerolineae bacterium]
MSHYLKQLRVLDDQIDLDFWREPEGVTIAFDELKFLYIPDQVEAMMVADLARQVYEYQIEHIETGEQITKAVMITMGALLPGVLLHDHLAYHPNKRLPSVEFGTLGVKYYAGPGQPLEKPIVIQDVTIDVRNQIVGVVEDLVDLGGTAKFVSEYLSQHGARDTILIAPYLKSRNLIDEMRVIYFGFVPKDTWIITPRERVETLIKRVRYWCNQGAGLSDCHANLAAIGYPEYLIDLYLPSAFEANC